VRILRASRPPSTSRLAAASSTRARVVLTDIDVDGIRLTTRRIPSARPDVRGVVLLPGLGLSAGTFFRSLRS
jgi:hypothetical protein